MKYYYPEHLDGYERAKAEGKVAWGEIHGCEGFENFSARGFLETVPPTLRFNAPGFKVIFRQPGHGGSVACVMRQWKGTRDEIAQG